LQAVSRLSHLQSKGGKHTGRTYDPPTPRSQPALRAPLLTPANTRTGRRQQGAFIQMRAGGVTGNAGTAPARNNMRARPPGTGGAEQREANPNANSLLTKRSRYDAERRQVKEHK